MEGKNLVIVESPGKIKKLQEALGTDYVVKASIGHIRDLDENGLSIDIDNGFKPKYVIPAEKKKVVADLKKEAQKASIVWLASDADREGEAISWHIFEADSSLALLRQRPGAFPLSSCCLLCAKP